VQSGAKQRRKSIGNRDATHALPLIAESSVHVSGEQFGNMVLKTLLKPVGKGQIVRIGTDSQLSLSQKRNAQP
jgi:hypothetical protein